MGSWMSGYIHLVIVIVENLRHLKDKNLELEGG